MATLSIQGSPNYAATIAEYDPANEVILPNRDRVIGYSVLGYQSIVGKGEYEHGELIVVLVAGTQVSPEFASENNLYRDATKNRDVTQTGYLEDNRRIKAISLGGNRSDALVMPLRSLWPFANPADAWHELTVPGATFTHIGDAEVCRKYVRPVKENAQRPSQGQKRVRVATHMFPEHFDTAQLRRNMDAFDDSDHVVITQKLHGTSVRLANVPVARDLSWRERIAKRLGIPVRESEYGCVVGSRRVTKSVLGKAEGSKVHWYESGDIWTTATASMHNSIPKNFIVFAEIVGWTPGGAPIQKDYTYCIPQGEQRIFVYRVAVVNEDGDLVDLPWKAVERFCEARGWNVVPVLTHGAWGLARDVIDGFLDANYTHDRAGWLGDPVMEPVPLPKNIVDEGICVRTDNGFNPLVLKHKSPKFLAHESKMLDQEVPDLEDVMA